MRVAALGSVLGFVGSRPGALASPGALRHKPDGFTLVELMLVVGLLGLRWRSNTAR